MRDLLDVRDVAEAYLGILASGAPGEAYNIARGEGVSLRELFERVGFRVHLHEYFDEAGTFHHSPWDDDAAGRIWRSERRDKRNRDGKLNFTSIILDAIKD